MDTFITTKLAVPSIDYNLVIAGLTKKVNLQLRKIIINLV